MVRREHGGSMLEAGQALRRGEVTSVELTERALAVAGGLGVDRGPVQGIPLGVKDLIAVAEGRRVTR